MKFTSPVAVADEIVRFEQRLAELRRLKRALLGGQASGRARQKPHRDEKIRAYYLQGRGQYGIVKKIAVQTGLSVRQVQRIIRNGGITRETVADDRSGPAVVKTGRKPKTLSNRLSTSVDPILAGRLPRAAESPGNRTFEFELLDDVLNDADGLVETMYEDAREARIPGGPRLDVEAALRLIKSLADEWNDLLFRLQEALGPSQVRPRKRSPELPLE